MGGKPRAFKHQLGPDRIRVIATALESTEQSFDAAGFVRAATRGLPALELKARVQHIIERLHEFLPQPFPDAVEAILAAVRCDDERPQGPELRGFAAWPLTDYVGNYGLEHWRLSLDALRRLTERFSAEFAIRPFLERYPAKTLEELHSWTRDSNEHVRRLVSEGTRPLLPWGRRLRQFQRDPTPVLALLEELATDPSEYVRRSVANNLNDISKDHPETVVETCRRWMRTQNTERERLVRRALRTLVKAGHPGALRVLGFGSDAHVSVRNLAVIPRSVREGESLELHFHLESTAPTGQKLSIDYAVHFVKANGSRSAKVFKLRTLQLGAAEVARIRKKHSMKAVTTRVHYPGTHTIELLINGKSMGMADFELAR